MLDGEVFGLSGPKNSHADVLLEQLVADDRQTLLKLEGRFVAALWCDDAKRLTLYTDKFASLPLYYCTAGQSFGFSTSINALRTMLPSGSTMNRAGLVQFFTYGHLWNDDTFHESVRATWPASKIVVDDGTVNMEQYWTPSASSPQQSDPDCLDRLTESFQSAVRQQSQDTDGLGVALSGGLDARTMLAMVDTRSVSPKCVSLGMEGSLDQRSARKLAELAGCEFHSLILGEGFLEGFRDHLTRMVQLTDGHYLSQCIVMPTFPLYTSLGIKTLMRGHVGELLHMHKAYNFSVDDSFDAVRSSEQLEAWLGARLQSHLTDGVNEQLFVDIDEQDFREIGTQTLRTALERTERFDRPLDRLSQLFLDQRTRRETAMSLVKFSSVADPRVPYLDSGFIDSVFASSKHLRIGETIQTHMLRKSHPKFLKPANSNTGAPVGVSELRRTLSYYRMRVFAKLGVPGYQPYERLGLWLRRELSETVKEILLDSECLDRGLFNPQCVTSVVGRHLNSEANHTFLIMAMMIMELGLRKHDDVTVSSNSRSDQLTRT